jgi:hypothetical protein
MKLEQVGIVWKKDEKTSRHSGKVVWIRIVEASEVEDGDAEGEEVVQDLEEVVVEGEVVPK